MKVRPYILQFFLFIPLFLAACSPASYQDLLARGDNECASGSEASAYTYAKAIALEPSSRAAYVGLAQCSETRSEKSARKEYLATLRGETALGAERAQALVEYREGNYHEAIRQFKNTLTPDEGIFVTYSYLGLAYQQVGLHEDAIKYFEKALSVNSEDATTLYDYSTSLINVKRYADAILALEHASKLNPNDANAFYQIALSYRASGDRELTAKYYKLFLNRSVANEALKPKRGLAGKWLELYARRKQTSDTES